MVSPIYKYEAFDLKKPAIRLLRLIPDQYNTPISCKIEEVLLGEEGVPYEALSYTWGDLSLQESINIVDHTDGTICSLMVTKNLYTALQYLRDPKVERRLWADAVCINQKDDEERGQQISQMRQVYLKAESVIIWLGDFTSNDPDDNTPHSIDLLMKFAHELDVRATRCTTASTSVIETWEKEFRNLMASYGLMREDANSLTFGKKIELAMAHLLRNPWFTRVWIIQEVFNARSGLVVCGNGGRTMSVPTQTFAVLPSLVGLKPETQSQAILDIMPLKNKKRRGDWIQRADLKTLLVKFQDSQCREKKDYIYALLGIASDGHCIKPDYGIKDEVVFTNTIAYLLFSTTVDHADYPLPNDRSALLQALNDRNGLAHHILMWAISKRHYLTAMRILEFDNIPLDLNKCGNAKDAGLGKTPLAFLAERGDPSSEEVIKKILSFSDADVNFKMNGQTALHLAIKHGHSEVVRLLLQRKDLRVNATNSTGDTPLCEAVFKGDIDLVGLLLTRRDASVVFPGADGYTPLDMAIAKKDIAMANLILEVRGAEATTTEENEEDINEFYSTGT